MSDRLGTSVAGGLAHRLSPEVAAGLAVIARVARALVGTASLDDLAQRGLAEMRAALDLELAALYLPAPSGRPLLQRRATAASGGSPRRAATEIAFDEEAWGLAVASGAPLVFRAAGSWLVDNPFDPVATSWLVLPLQSESRLLGVVIAAAEHPLALDPAAVTVLTLIGDLLTAGIATAQLRRQIERTELERERLRLAGLVHDGLAQDLALATRELALQEDAALPAELVAASRDRLRAAVASANATVRDRLKELSAPVPLGGLRDGVQMICDRFAERGLTVRVRAEGPEPTIAPATAAVVARVLTEALTNVEKHAGPCAADVSLSLEDGRLSLVVADDGRGFDGEAGGGRPNGHLGLVLMRERAREVGGTVTLTSTPGHGTLVRLQAPIA